MRMGNKEDHSFIHFFTQTKDENEWRSMINTSLCVCSWKEGERRKETRIEVLDPKYLNPTTEVQWDLT